MHRTEGPNYATESGKRRYRESPTPETVVNKFAMNAIQEEIAGPIEAAGLTLAVTGAADRTAEWGQLTKAILRLNTVNVLSFGADPTGVADSTAAFNAAWAYSSIIYAPPGAYKIIPTISGAFTIPANAVLLGAGLGLTDLICGKGTFDSFPIFKVTTQSLKICNLTMIDIIDSDSTGIYANFDGVVDEQAVILENVHIKDMYVGLQIQADTTKSVGFFYGKNVYVETNVATATNVVCGPYDNTEYPPQYIHFENLKSIVSDTGFADFNIEINQSDTKPSAPCTIDAGYIYGSTIEFWKNTERCWIRGSHTDIDTYSFSVENGGGYQNCQEGSILSNSGFNEADPKRFWNIDNLDYFPSECTFENGLRINNFQSVNLGSSTTESYLRWISDTLFFKSEDILNVQSSNNITMRSNNADVDIGAETTVDISGKTRVDLDSDVEIQLDAPSILVNSKPLTYNIGDWAHGGVVFWVDDTKRHGLVCAKEDQGDQQVWMDGGGMSGRSISPKIYSGKANTHRAISVIIADGCISSDDNRFNSCALFTCADYSEGIYGDWYLPALDELMEMYTNKTAINATAIAHGGSALVDTPAPDIWNDVYWSSTEDDATIARMKDFAYGIHFEDGASFIDAKWHALLDHQFRVRAVRSF